MDESSTMIFIVAANTIACAQKLEPKWLRKVCVCVCVCELCPRRVPYGLRIRETTTGDHNGRPRATDSGAHNGRPQRETTGYGFGSPQRETTTGDHTTGDHGLRVLETTTAPQGETTGGHGQRIRDPAKHPAALEELYRTLSCTSCLGNFSRHLNSS